MFSRNKPTVTVRNDFFSNSREEKQQQQQQQKQQYYRTPPPPTPPSNIPTGLFSFLPNEHSSASTKLGFSIILDIIGFFTQIIPVFGIMMWPAISSYLIYRVYGSGVAVMISFIEETIPGLGFIPTATLCYANEKYNLLALLDKYFPILNQLGGIRKIFNNVVKGIKVCFMSLLGFILYKLYYYIFSSTPSSSNPSYA
eukprot:gene3612-4496_t